MNTLTKNYRYRILALVFFATTINYMDRSVIGVLGPTLRNTVFHWSNADYAWISISFKLAYAIGMISMGSIIDKMGTRLGYTLSIAIWSIFGMIHAAIRPGFGFVGFVLARFGLGVGESGNFPSAIKTVAEWFPKKDRAFATGIFNAGSNVGAILAPILIALIVNADTGKNWQCGFLMTGIFSAIWVVLWRRTYKKPEDHPKVSAEELAYIQQDEAEETTEQIPWKKVAKKKQTWAFAIGKLTDAVWWFYLFWGAFFLNDKFGLDLKDLALPLIIIYVLADFGSILGGWLSKYFMNLGWGVNKARKITLLICALCIMPVMFATQTENQWIAVCLIGLAAAGHQAWSANLFTLVSDVFPKKATASVVGIGGMIGALAGMIADFGLGSVLDTSGETGYFFAFLIAGLLYLGVLLIIHLMMPKLNPVEM